MHFRFHWRICILGLELAFEFLRKDFQKSIYNMWKVYKRICPNGKVYIGITKRTLEERMSGGYTNNLEFARAVEKFGKENIKSEILEEHETYDQAAERELYYIRQYQDICYNKVGNVTKNEPKHRYMSRTVRSAQSNLHNEVCTEGSAQNACTETSAQSILHRIPISTKPANRHSCPISTYTTDGQYITTYPDAKTAAQETGVNHGDIISCCKGSKSDGVQRYQCKGLVFRYAVDKLDEYPDTPVASKRVNQYTLDGEYIRTFDSMKEAFLHTGVSLGTIGRICRGIRTPRSGYIWKYADPENNLHLDNLESGSEDHFQACTQ